MHVAPSNHSFCFQGRLEFLLRGILGKGPVVRQRGRKLSPNTIHTLPFVLGTESVWGRGVSVFSIKRPWRSPWAGLLQGPWGSTEEYSVAEAAGRQLLPRNTTFCSCLMIFCIMSFCIYVSCFVLDPGKCSCCFLNS